MSEIFYKDEHRRLGNQNNDSGVSATPSTLGLTWSTLLCLLARCCHWSRGTGLGEKPSSANSECRWSSAQISEEKGKPQSWSTLPCAATMHVISSLKLCPSGAKKAPTNLKLFASCACWRTRPTKNCLLTFYIISLKPKIQERLFHKLIIAYLPSIW